MTRSFVIYNIHMNLCWLKFLQVLFRKFEHGDGPTAHAQTRERWLSVFLSVHAVLHKVFVHL